MLIWFLVIAGAVILDQASKLFVMYGLGLDQVGESIPLIEDVFHFTHVRLHGAFFFSLPLATLLPLMIDTKIRMNSSSSPPFPSIRLFLPLHNHLSRMETGQFFMWSRTQVPEDSPSPMSFSITIPSRCSVFPVSHLLSLPWVLLIYLLVYSL